MLANDGFTLGVVARLLDFVGDLSPWQRRLWTVGTILRLQEADEAIGLSAEATGLRDASVKEAMASARDLALQDPGVGSEDERRRLAALLSTAVHPGSEEHHRLREIIRTAQSGYLSRWIDAVRAAPERVEFVARVIAAHLMDSGSSPGHLYRLLDWLQRDGTATYGITDILDHIRGVERDHEMEVLLPFFAIPSFDVMPDGWTDAEGSHAWLVEKLPTRPGTVDGRPAELVRGGIIWRGHARDAGAAVEQLSDVIETYGARVDVGAKAVPGRGGFVPAASAFVAGTSHPLPLRPRRHVAILALERERRLFDPVRGSVVDSALELVALLDRGSPAAAVAGGWAGVESLLKGPGDGGAHKVAPRLASLVACSFVRAELTTLAWRQIRKSGKNDAARSLSAELRSFPSNEQRAGRVAELLLSGTTLGLPSSSDTAAEARTLKLLQQPNAGLRDVLRFAEDPLRRLYRQRNLVLHGGKTDGVALRASLRVAAPLVGAAVDRIAHAWFTRQVEPLRLASIARLRLDRLETPDASPLTSLLE
jgi:hypothetical protein